MLICSLIAFFYAHTTNFYNLKTRIIMKKSELSFAEGFTIGANRGKIARKNGAMLKAFDWDKAAKVIKDKLIEHPNLEAEAGLQNDWSCTGGVIFENGKPTNDSYTYLCSNWATPTLVLMWDGQEQEEIDCWIEKSERFNADTKWDNESLQILGIEL